MYTNREKISEVQFSSYEFLDEHHILYAISKEDSICVYDLPRDQQQKQEPPQKEKEKEIRLVRFQMSLPPINHGTTSRYIYLRRNALPLATGNQPLPDRRSPLSDSEGPSAPATPPFHADPQERLIVVRISTSPVEWGQEQFELHVPARTFLHHISSSTATAANKRNRQNECKDEVDDGVVVVPWSAWGNAVHATPPRKLPYAVQPRMNVYGMHAVSHPPDWDAGVLRVDSYLPRARRRKGRGGEAEAYGMRQAIKLPQEVEDKTDYLSALCEDALLLYKVSYRTRALPPFFSTGFLMDLLQVDPLSSKISHAYWYTF